ncbi:MATE family efflux transporter [uncultured Muribaculum sp.]|uniref:MATE family efflux transporter n=1 Tax=uncultured Muribaculum sp. TaxID=1918613 RepID=UPI00272D9CF3|nr:MATE family efflux transporter [uncultured Muribaculum sp.]
MQENLNALSSRPIGRLLWEYSLPGVVGMLVMALYNVVDRIFIGQVVGPEAIAGLAITFPLMNIATAIGVLVGAGSSAWVSILLGRRDYERAGTMLGNALTLTFINGTIYIVAFALWIDPLLRAFGAGDLTLPYGRTYMLWVLPGLLLTNIAFGFNNIMRASGYPVRAMMTMLIGAVTNVALDAVLVLGLDMGMIGAAIATDVAMAVSALFVMWHFFRPGVTLRFSRGTFSLRGSVVWDIISIGAAPSLVNIASCLINILINKSLVAHGGDMAIGAAGIFVTYASLLTTAILGICMGLQPIIGYNYGAGHFHRLRKALWLACGAATVICVCGSVVGLVFPRAIARAFTTDDFLLDVSENCLRISMVAFSVVGFQIISTTFFQSIGSSGKAIFLSLTRQVIFLIPLLVWLPGEFGVDGVWMSFPISDTLATIVTAAMVWWQLHLISRRQPLPAPAAN